MKTIFVMFVLLSAGLVVEVSAQKKAVPFKVCGDPSAACAKRAIFKDDDIPFDYTEGSVVAESLPFYIVIIKSSKLPDNGVCENTPDDYRRQDIQWNFLRNKVFIARGCYSIENNFYSKLGTNVIALAIFAGHTKAEADAFLKKVKATESIDAKDAYLLRTTTGFNGT